VARGHGDANPRIAHTTGKRVKVRRREPSVLWVDLQFATRVCVRILDPSGDAKHSGVVRLLETVPDVGQQLADRRDLAVVRGASGASRLFRTAPELASGEVGPTDRGKPLARANDVATLVRGAGAVELFRSFPEVAARVRIEANHCDPVTVPLPAGVHGLSVVVEARASLEVIADGVRAADGFRLALVSDRRGMVAARNRVPRRTTGPALRSHFEYVGDGVWDVVLRWRSRTIGVLERVTLAPHEQRTIRVDASRFGFAPVRFRIDSSMAPPGCIEFEGITTAIRRVGTVDDGGKVEVYLPMDRYRVFLRSGRDRWPADRELVVAGGGDAGLLRFR
jgi:hypothetical protein